MDKRFTERYIEELAHKFKTGRLTPEEQADLDAWYEQHNDTEFQHSEGNEPEHLKDRLLTNILAETHPKTKSKILTLWPRIGIAASLLLILSYGSYLFLHQRPVQQLAQNQRHDIAPGRNQATLTLANGQQIILTKGLNGKLAQQGNTTISVNAGKAIAYAATNTEAAAAVEYNTLTTVRGEQSPYPLILADGTKAWLNAASSITFPTAFNGKDRAVKITGEVYFEVAHNEKQPFKVEAKGQTIEDIGTAFNVNAYNDEPETQTTLISGIVKVNGRALKPGQAASGVQAMIKEADTEGAIAWKNNYFKFDHEDLGNTMREVSRWYNVEIVYPSGKPVSENYYGTMSRFSNLSKVLSKLEFIGNAKFKIEGNKVIVTQK
jgi:transmembrane sensor